jgi:hypothetical protein
VNKLEPTGSLVAEVISIPEEDLLFRLLRQLDAAPDASQRATAGALGVSLGRLNALLRARPARASSRSPKSNPPTGVSARPIS